MADECTDIDNKEQFVVCIRWVDEALIDHEDVIGVYNVGTIDANTLTAAIFDCNWAWRKVIAMVSAIMVLPIWLGVELELLHSFLRKNHMLF